MLSLMSPYIRALLVVVIAVLGKLWIDYNNHNSQKQQALSVLRRLRKHERDIISREHALCVAVGFGGYLEASLNAISFLRSLNISASNGTHSFEQPINLVQLEQTFTQVFRHGSAAEHYFDNNELFREIVKSVRRNNKTAWSVGGVPLAMGQQFALDGCEVLLGMRTSGRLQRMMPNPIRTVKEHLARDDVHVCLEYSPSDRWGDLQSTKANRFVFHRDHENPLGSLEAFERELVDYEADLIVVAGMHILDKFPYRKDMRLQRLNILKNLLTKTPYKSRVHLEIGPVENRDFYHELLRTVLPYIDSIGLNEQDLPNLEHVLTTGDVLNSLDILQPGMSEKLDQARQIFSVLESTPLSDGRRRLSRLHLHTVAHEVIMVHADHKAAWRNSRLAVAKAALVALRHNCGDEKGGQNDYRLSSTSFSVSDQASIRHDVEMNTSDPVSCWKENKLELCVAPVLSCENSHRTFEFSHATSPAALTVQL